MILAIALAAVFQFGCGEPFKVKPKTDLPPGRFGAVARAGAIELQAESITDEDVLYHVFDANLIMAGLFPVRVVIANTGATPASIKKASFSVVSSDGISYKPVSGSRAFKRLMRYYEIENYQKFGYRQSRDDFLSYSLDVNGPLDAGQRSGFLFFAVPPDKAREPGFSLVVRHVDSRDSKGSEDVKLKLN
ncbi:MAG: hypothetical protein ACREAC_13430 [Blastocatellia bacterium]